MLLMPNDANSDVNGVMMPVMKAVVSHYQNVMYLIFDNLDLCNAVAPLKKPLASCDTEIGAIGVM